MLLVSVVIKFDNWGRMGNRMFQYAFAKVLFNVSEVYHFDGLPNFNIQPNPPTRGLVNPLYLKTFGNNYVDFNKIYTHSGDIVVDSFVQKSKYYLDHRDCIKQLFGVVDHPITNKDKLVVHVRETDYLQVNSFLGYEFYRDLIKDSGYTDIVIVTDNSNCDTVKRLVSEGCKLNTEGFVGTFEHTSDTRGMSDFNVLLQSANIALSQSSYSWWAAFLGNHDNIIFPFKRSCNMWPVNPGEDDADLYFELKNSLKYIKD